MRKILKFLLAFFSLLLVAELGFLGYMMTRKPEQAIQAPPSTSATEAAVPAPTVPETTVAPTTEPRAPE